MECAPFNDEPISTKKVKFNFKNPTMLSFGEVDPYDRDTITAENIYKSSFLLLQQPTKMRYDKMTMESVKNISCNSELSRVFFSDENIKRIQRLLRKEIIAKSNGKFKMDVDQDEKQLVYVMRAIFIEYARDIPNQVIRQVKHLNKLVIEEIFPSIISSIQHIYGYQKSIHGPVLKGPLINTRPINDNNAGRRILPSITSIWEF